MKTSTHFNYILLTFSQNEKRFRQKS